MKKYKITYITDDSLFQDEIFHTKADAEQFAWNHAEDYIRGNLKDFIRAEYDERYNIVEVE